MGSNFIVGAALGLVAAIVTVMIWEWVSCRMGYNPIIESEGNIKVVHKEEFGGAYNLLPPNELILVSGKDSFAVEKHYENKKLIIPFQSYDLYDSYSTFKRNPSHRNSEECCLCDSNTSLSNAVESYIVHTNESLNIAYMKPISRVEPKTTYVCRDCISEFHPHVLERSTAIDSIPSQSERVAAGL